LRVGDILEKRVSSKYTISERLWQSHQDRKNRHVQNGNGFGYRLFSRASNYTSTLSARYYKDGAEILISQKNKCPRKITPREAARLQGFPENYQLNASDVQAYRQFGNAVPVNIVRAIAESLLPILIEE
jgi:DNA (cytosine-5)-methyltransferase 1